jgi:Copper type II ascorbate-dependent monooxygenase, C-terminal domain
VLLRSKIYPLYVSLFLTVLARAGAPPAGPTFNKDILPILQTRCQPCHRPGEIGPMPLITYDQTKPWAKAIQEAVKTRKMPPWFADTCCGQFSTDHTLKPEEIALINAWVTGGAIEGKKKDARPLLRWTNNWTIDGPSVAVSLPRAFEVPANSIIDYQYVILPLDLADDHWASAVEIHPSDRSIVHHAVVYVRQKDSKWLRNVPPLTMYAPPPGSLSADELGQQAGTDILAVYTPGSPAAIWPSGMGKKLPAGSDLVLQLHYTSKKTAASDRTSVGINFLKEPPKQRVLTLQMQNRAIVIPPGASDYHASVSGTMPRDAMLISMFPHMHLRGSAFEYAIVHPDGKLETLLRVKPYDFFWQQSYPLKTPRLLPRGTKLLWTGYFDNSANNPRNPDPKAEVRWGEQSWEEMMVGFFDVAVDASVDKVGFFSSPNP